MPNPPHSKGCYVKENSPLKGQFTRLKKTSKKSGQIDNMSINNSQAKNYFYFRVWLEKAVLMFPISLNNFNCSG
jgi:hypothetical protein